VEGKGMPAMKMKDLHSMPLGELRRLMGEVSGHGYPMRHKRKEWQSLACWAALSQA
jgi:hypothetical protein